MLLDDGQDAPGLEAVGVQGDLVGRDVVCGIRAVRPGVCRVSCMPPEPEAHGHNAGLPGVVALAPGRNVLGDEVWAHLLCLGRGTHAADAVGARGVVDGDQALPAQVRWSVSMCVV